MPRLLSWTSALSVAFLAYFGYTFYTLFKLAVPDVPPLVFEDGRPKPVIKPLWAQSKKGLTFELALSLAQRPSTSKSLSADGAPLELSVLHLGRLPYNWTLGASVQLEFEVVRRADSKGGSKTEGSQIAGLRVFCSDVAKDSTAAVSETASNPTCREIARLMDKRHNCSRTTPSGMTKTGSTGSSGALFELQGSSLLLTLGTKLKGALAAAKRALQGGETSAVASEPHLAEEKSDSVVPLLLTEMVDVGDASLSTLSPSVYGVSALKCSDDGSAVTASKGAAITARRIAIAITSGTAVYAHSKVAWVSKGEPSDPAKVLFASAPLVAPMEYRPPKQVRFLWEDPWGEATAEQYRLELHRNGTLPVETASKTLLAAAAVNKMKGKGGSGGYTRVFLNTTAGPTAASGSHYLPSEGHNWPYWAGSLDVKLIMDTQPFPRDEVPPQLRPYLRVDPSNSYYIPLLAANPVRPTRDSYHPLNHSISAPLPLKVSLKPISIGSWQLLQTLDTALTAQQSLGASDRDTDEVVRLVSETPMWLLTLTFVVSVFHLLLDLLAIQSDVSFWRGTKSLRGISARSLAIQLGSSVIITAYLWSEGSSLLVLVPQAISTLLLVWKLFKALGFVLTTKWRVLPWFTFDADLAATATAETSRYDQQAVVFMSLVLSPLVLGFALYSFVHHKYAGWSDFLLTTAVSAVYTFGFALMVPQLWINYRLKSVAAMSFSVFTFRFFNTVIDDLFAFIITMPAMTRLSVFRDDIIFVVYLVQRWKYRIDTSRPSEAWDGNADDGAAVATQPGPATEASGEDGGSKKQE